MKKIFITLMMIAGASFISLSYASETYPEPVISDSGRVITIPQDDCPYGDYSPSMYDNDCNINVYITTTGGIYTGVKTPLQTTGTTTSTGLRFDADPCADPETEDAFVFAHNQGITTMDTCVKARMQDTLTRGEAAKMLVILSMNILNKQKSDAACRFNSQEFSDNFAQGYAILACQYGIMGLKGDGTPAATFNPTGLVDKAQFATMISRLLYGNTYNNNPACRYCNHVAALNANGIMNVTTDLTNPILRTWAFIMIHRIGDE